MVDADRSPVVIAGPVSRKVSNRLRILFSDGPGSTIATALQSGSDGRVAAAWILLGFINGGPGRHTLDLADGRRLVVASVNNAPTEITLDGRPYATIDRATVTVARDPSGREIVRFSSDPVDAKTPDLYRLNLTLPDGTSIGDLDVIRRGPGWTLLRTLDWATTNPFYWWDHAGGSLKIPLLGARLVLTEPVAPLVQDVLLAACVDIAIGIRPYIDEMR